MKYATPIFKPGTPTQALELTALEQTPTAPSADAVGQASPDGEERIPPLPASASPARSTGNGGSHRSHGTDA